MSAGCCLAYVIVFIVVVVGLMIYLNRQSL